MEYPRYIEKRLLEALADTPVVFVGGARQTGKTTLARRIPGYAYSSLDTVANLAAAQGDPDGFVAGLPERVLIDEVQRAPELFRALKISVDRDRRPGRFLLTGSANVLLLPRLSESLAGRVELLTLWPLAQAEIAGGTVTLIDDLFSLPLPAAVPAIRRADLITRVLMGGYPEPRERPTEARRRAWFQSYLTTILTRDIQEMSHIEDFSDLPRLLALLAARTGSLLNLTDISNTADVPYTTLQRRMNLLKATYLIQETPAWSGNLTSRLIKTPKIGLNDTGLTASLLGLNAERLEADPSLLGGLLETFVAMELRKAISWSELQPTLYHFRTHARQEVDLVLESPDGRVVGIEVKAGANISSSDFKGLRTLSETVGDRFVRGVILYGGTDITPFGERLHAVPLSLLWR